MQLSINTSFFRNVPLSFATCLPPVWFCAYPTEHNLYLPGIVPRAYRAYERSGYGYGSLAQLTEVPGGYTNVVPVPAPAPGYFHKGIPYPGYCVTGVQNFQKFRVRVRMNVVQNLQKFWYGYYLENTPGMVLDVPYRAQLWLANKSIFLHCSFYCRILCTVFWYF